jgi:XisI protein
MDRTRNKIKKYQKLITDYLTEYASVKPANLSDCESIVIADTQGNHFQVLTMGWEKGKYVHSIVFHLDIAENGKIWLRANWTDTDIAELLVEKGVPKSDIVLGFFPKDLRALSDYAVA